MDIYDEIYGAFMAALRYFLDKEGYGGRSFLAGKAGISNAMMTQILHESKPKKVGKKLQTQLAKACGYELVDFIAFGRKLLDRGSESLPVEMPAVCEPVEQPISALASDYIESLKQQIDDFKVERSEWKAQKEEWKEERAEFKKEIAELKERIRSLEAQLSMTAEYDVKKIAG